MNMNLYHRAEGLGTDIIEIDRIRHAIEQHGDQFLNKLFTVEEIAYCLNYRDPAPRFAGRFAAKEAIVKALGSGITARIGWQDINIFNNSEGQPLVQLSQRLHKAFGPIAILLSISHCRSFATATALVLTSETHNTNQ